MNRDYSELLSLAAELEMFRGYLSPEEEKREGKLRMTFNGARNRFVYSVLRDEGDADSARALVSSDLDELAAGQPEWSTTIDYVRNEIFDRIHREAGKSPTIRKIVRWGPLALGIAALIAYFIVRLISSVEINQPMESRAGIEQRAGAFKKAARYDDWMSGVTRRRWVMEILLWPIEPDESEIKGAQEFVVLTEAGFGSLASDRIICGAPAAANDDQLSDEQIELISKVADYVRRDDTRWLQPPIMTILEPIKEEFPCR